MNPTKLNPIMRKFILRSIVKESGDDLSLTPRERVMIKFFLKFITISIINLMAWYLPTPIIITYVKNLQASLSFSPISTSYANASSTKDTKRDVKDDDSLFIDSSKTIRGITMYNAGDPQQCDSSPCISANGENICLALELGYNRCAANFVPLGTYLHIEKLGRCLVTDRMNSRYPNRVDWALSFTEEQHQRALNFGLQNLEVTILKEL